VRVRLHGQAERLLVEAKRAILVLRHDHREVRARDLCRWLLPLLERCVPPVQEQVVAIWVGERSAMTNTRVERIHGELDPRLLERAAGLGDVRNAERDRAAERGEREGDVRRLVLHPALSGGVRVARKPERVPVEVIGTGEIADGDGDEVDALDLDHGTVTGTRK
jgi:hypothetical protein